MDIAFLRDVFREFGDAEAISHQGNTSSYRSLLQQVDNYRDWLRARQITSGSVVALKADFSAHSTACLLALVEADCIVVPLSESVHALHAELMEIAQAEFELAISDGGEATVKQTEVTADHELLQTLRNRRHPGLILFTSGSTGARKAVVHDFALLLEKFRTRRVTKRILTFFLFDHIGGLDTLLHTLSNGGYVVTVPDRNVESICRLIEQHRIEVLPVSPTFINLLLMSEAYKRFDLSSLQIVTYGTEVMSPDTLTRLCAALPWVNTLQKYGLSEIGTLRSRSESNNSCWVKLGGEGMELRVVDGQLEIKARSAMLGYLNAPAPFTVDGWYKTGDSVEVKGEYYRILGRQSEQINVGGEKFYPAEAEQILADMDDVLDVTVSSRDNPITGSIVVATFHLETDEKLADFRARMRGYCQDRMPSYMVPQKVVLSEQALHSERFKKRRR